MPIYVVPSLSEAKTTYLTDSDEQTCTCKAWLHSGSREFRYCKHLRFVTDRPDMYTRVLGTSTVVESVVSGIQERRMLTPTKNPHPGGTKPKPPSAPPRKRNPVTGVEITSTPNGMSKTQPAEQCSGDQFCPDPDPEAEETE